MKPETDGKAPERAALIAKCSVTGIRREELISNFYSPIKVYIAF